MIFFKQKKSISVRSIAPNENIYVTNDERFSGLDNCLECEFNPCKVKKWYGKRKKIENCKLWNNFRPTGTIVDNR